MKVMVLVLGDYVNVSKFVEGIPFIHEKYLLNTKGDLFNLKYRDGKGEFKIQKRGDDIDVRNIGDLDKVIKQNKEMVLNILLGENSCRRRSEDDVIGLYGSDSEVKMHIEEGLEDLEVDVYFNYLNKYQDYGELPYLMYIIDNTSSNTNTLNNIEFIMNKVNCETVIHTSSPKENFEELQEEYSKKDILLEVFDL